MLIYGFVLGIKHSNNLIDGQNISTSPPLLPSFLSNPNGQGPQDYCRLIEEPTGCSR